MISMALQRPPADADRARLEARERELDVAETELAEERRELHRLQQRYLDEIGEFYDTLSRLEARVVEAEVRAGLRPPFDCEAQAAADAAADADDRASHACGERGAPSDDLKRVFRDLAKAIHPDLAEDEPARCRRHSLMAEANRAYAERDEDRLRLIRRAWEGGPEAADDDPDDSGGARVRRRLAAIDARLVLIGTELADLRASAIWRLKARIDEARAQGWDLFAEMILQVKREIARATARLRRLDAGVRGHNNVTAFPN